MMINNEDIPNFEDHTIKNLRRHSSLLTFILIISLPILLIFFNIACTPRRTIVESFEEIYHMLTFDFDCLAIVLGWFIFQVR